MSPMNAGETEWEGFDPRSRRATELNMSSTGRCSLKAAVVNWIGRPAPVPWDSQRGDLRGGAHGPKGDQ